MRTVVGGLLSVTRIDTRIRTLVTKFHDPLSNQRPLKETLEASRCKEGFIPDE